MFTQHTVFYCFTLFLTDLVLLTKMLVKSQAALLLTVAKA